MSFTLLGILNAQAAGGGSVGVPAYDLIETTDLASPASSVTISNITTKAADYQHLQLRLEATGTDSTGTRTLGFTVNGDTSANSYITSYMKADGSSAQTGFRDFEEAVYVGLIGHATRANEQGAVILDIYDFASSTKQTTIRFAHMFAMDNFSNTSLGNAVYDNTSPFDSITFFPNIFGSSNFTAGSRFSLYGIKGEL